MDHTSVTLALESDLSPDQLQEITRQLKSDLIATGQLDAELPQALIRDDERALGGLVLGQIALAFFGGSGVKALIDCLKAYLTRERSLKFKLKRKDGSTMEFDASRLSATQYSSTLSAMQEFVQESSPRE